MIKIENSQAYGWEAAIRGMRNPHNSWDKSDSFWDLSSVDDDYIVGDADYNLMMKLAKGGSVHAKYRRMITVTVDITAPLYWWKEFDTYKVGTVANSCSTMHKIHDKEFALADFSTDKIFETDTGWIDAPNGIKFLSPLTFFEGIVHQLNVYREWYLATNDKKYWWQMIQLLPSSYNQKRTVLLNYEVLANIYDSRRGHKLDEWREFCKWIGKLPYSKIITLEGETNENN